MEQVRIFLYLRVNLRISLNLRNYSAAWLLVKVVLKAVLGTVKIKKTRSKIGFFFERIKEALAIPWVHRLASVEIGLHSVFHFVLTFYFPVKFPHSYHVQSVSNEVGLYNQVYRALTCQRGTQVDFDEPRLQITIDQNVISKEFKATVPMNAGFLHRVKYGVFSADDAFHNDVKDSGPE